MAFPAVFDQVCQKNDWAREDSQVEITLDGGRKQKVVLDAFVHENEQLARAYTIVGKIDSLSEVRLKSALRINFELVFGALAIHEGFLVLADTYLVRDADPDEVEASMRYIAQAADRYEKLIYGTDTH